MKTLLIASLGILAIATTTAAAAVPIEPRSLTWNIVSDREMSKICRENGLRANCEGMAAWDKEYQTCIIWTRSPRDANDAERWQVVHHELRHCQEGHFHK
jgi:hypothetical protein